MGILNTKNQGPILIAITVSVIALSAFLYQTGLVNSPLILFFLCIFLLYPYRRESRLAQRIMALTILLFIGWLLSDLGFALMPFIISFLLAYLLDPFVSFLARKNIPRWVASMMIILIFLGIVTLIAVFVFPSIFSQLKAASYEVSILVSSISSLINSREFYDFLSQLGIDEETARNAIEHDILPRLEGLMMSIFGDLDSLFTNVKAIANQLLNIVLIPVISFYFLKDFRKLKEFLKSILRQKNRKFLYNLRRINKIFKIYIGWQATAAIIVATVCSTFFSIFDIPYAIVLGIICGFLNPIPYLGVVGSFVICVIVILIVNPDNLLAQIITVLTVISVMHFINAYFLEPNIAGKQVGLHPLLLIASLFVFGGIFGFIGLLVAVPCTATMMMFFNDWREASLRSRTSIYDS